MRSAITSAFLIVTIVSPSIIASPIPSGDGHVSSECETIMMPPTAKEDAIVSMFTSSSWYLPPSDLVRALIKDLPQAVPTFVFSPPSPPKVESGLPPAAAEGPQHNVHLLCVRITKTINNGMIRVLISVLLPATTSLVVT
jgi:hypothetical protein